MSSSFHVWTISNILPTSNVQSAWILPQKKNIMRSFHEFYLFNLILFEIQRYTLAIHQTSVRARTETSWGLELNSDPTIGREYLSYHLTASPEFTLAESSFRSKGGRLNQEFWYRMWASQTESKQLCKMLIHWPYLLTSIFLSYWKPYHYIKWDLGIRKKKEKISPAYLYNRNESNQELKSFITNGKELICGIRFKTSDIQKKNNFMRSKSFF